LRDASGRQLTLALDLRIDQASGTVGGTVRALTASTAEGSE
jgi:hypothetical protein